MGVYSLLNEGILFAKERKNQEALSCFDQALAINPECQYIWQTRGQILQQLGKDNEALECYNKTIELNPDNAVAWSLKGDVLICMDKLTEALDYFERAVKLDPERKYAASTLKMLKEKLRGKVNADLSNKNDFIS